MAVTTPTKLTITKEQDFMFPAMAADPLKTALANSNHLYGYFTPNLLSFSPLGVGASTRSEVYVVPVQPSADSLTYDFWYTLLPTFSGTVTIQVESNTGANPATGWNVIMGPTAASLPTANVWTNRRYQTVVAANVRMLKFTLSAAGGNYTVGHICVQPSRFAVSNGIKFSGFIPFDDSLITGTGAPINTEHLNRCRTNALAILRDRQQCLASVVQPWCAKTIFGGGYVFSTDGYVVLTLPGQTYLPWAMIGQARAHVPGQTKFTATAYCIASVTGGGTTGLIEVNGQLLDATGLLVSTPLTLYGDGTQEATASFVVRVKANAGYQTYLQSLVVLWRPGD